MRPNVEVLAEGQAWVVRILGGVGAQPSHFRSETAVWRYAEALRASFAMPDDAAARIYLAALATSLNVMEADMSKSYRIIDLRSTIIDAEEKMVEAHSPEAAIHNLLGIDAVRSGAKKDLIARVYWQLSPAEPTNMVRMYMRLDPERAAAKLDRDKH